MENILIIGGVAAGMSAASRARRVAPEARVTVLERGPAVSYGACGLPGVLAGRIQRLEDLVAHPVEFFREQRGIEVRPGHEALEIEAGRRRVRARSEAGESWLSYDRLVIATGARSRWLPAGPRLRHVYAANTWDQVAQLRAALESGEIRRVAVVGAGYIGLEMAEALAQRGGLEVHLIHANATPLRGFDGDMVAELPARIAAAGITLHAGCRVRELAGPEGGRLQGVATSSGVIPADALVNCGGLRPETALAERAGILLGRSGAIAVDERQQTSVAGIYAAGDCAETRHRVSGAPVWIPLGAAANHQGRVAGQNAAGRRAARYPGVMGTLAVPLFGLEFGRTGLGESEARAAGMDAAATTVRAATRAAYMRGAPGVPEGEITLKIVYQPSTRRLLGCQAWGPAGAVTGQLDVAVTACSAGMKLEDVEHLDLAYSPALAPLYEPLQIAAHNALQDTAAST